MPTYAVYSVNRKTGKRTRIASGVSHGAAWDKVMSLVTPDWGKRVKVREVRYSVEEETKR